MSISVGEASPPHLVDEATRHIERVALLKPVLEDWIWHTLLPLTAYLMILTATLLAGIHTRGAFFAVASAALGLLFIGIHNAWDTVVWIVVNSKPELRDGK